MNQWPVLEASVERLCEKMRVCEFMRAVTCACGVRVLGVSNKSVRVCIHALICMCVCEPESGCAHLYACSHMCCSISSMMGSAATQKCVGMERGFQHGYAL